MDYKSASFVLNYDGALKLSGPRLFLGADDLATVQDQFIEILDANIHLSTPTIACRDYWNPQPCSELHPSSLFY